MELKFENLESEDIKRALGDDFTDAVIESIGPDGQFPDVGIDIYKKWLAESIFDAIARNDPEALGGNLIDAAQGYLESVANKKYIDIK